MVLYVIQIKNKSYVTQRWSRFGVVKLEVMINVFNKEILIDTANGLAERIVIMLYEDNFFYRKQ